MSLGVSDLRRFMAGVTTRLLLSFARALVRVVEESDGVQVIQVNVLGGELLENIQNPQLYGHASRPRPGSEVLVAFLAGDRSHGYVIADGDRRFRPRDLAEGDVALHTSKDTLGDDEEPREWQEVVEDEPTQGMHRIQLIEEGRVLLLCCDEIKFKVNGVESSLLPEGGSGLLEGLENMAQVERDKVVIPIGSSAGTYYIERGP